MKKCGVADKLMNIITGNTFFPMLKDTYYIRTIIFGYKFFY